jgi:hypothetical protein
MSVPSSEASAFVEYEAIFRDNAIGEKVIPNPIIEEAGEGVPPVEAVVDRFGRVAVLGEPGTLFAQDSDA